MRRPAVIRLVGLASILALCLFAVVVAFFPSSTHWSGTSIVRIRVGVCDNSDLRPIPGARVRLVSPNHPNNPMTGATTGDEGYVDLVNDFRTSGGKNAGRNWEVVSYGGW